LAKAELPQRLTAAAASDDPGPLHAWLDSLHGWLLDEVAVAERFEQWAAAQNRFEPDTRAAISKVRRQLTAHRRRAPAFLKLGDDIDTSINSLFEHLDAAAPLMAEHSRAVSAWCSRLARALDLTEAEIDFVTRGGLIHDIGKMRTPASILNAPRRLTPQEWAIMQRHAPEGSQIVSNVPVLRPFVPIVRGHHERLDGRGYPDGLRLSAIPLAARIVSVADSFNAMIGRRPYRAPLAPTDALAELQRNAHTQFDPEVVEAMVRIVLGRISDPAAMAYV
jgi:putative nucleotidyltransferase with HDIG domain